MTTGVLGIIFDHNSVVERAAHLSRRDHAFRMQHLLNGVREEEHLHLRRGMNRGENAGRPLHSDEFGSIHP